MDPLTLAAILGGVSLLKGMTLDKDKEDRQRELAAATQRYSPWTGLKAGEIKEADPVGSAIGGGLSGYSFGTNLQNAEAMKAMQGQDLKTPGASIAMEQREQSPLFMDNEPNQYLNTKPYWYRRG